ncbi:MAG: HD domain-containing protein [Candidatus Hydrogenedentes bacterium]|nr:HD domain-containing protein [Candidatus Hydrogenedentota bacterium]
MNPRAKNGADPVDKLFRSIPIVSLLADSVLDFDIYVRTRKDLNPVLFRGKDLPLTSDTLQRLSENRHESILIPVTQERAYARYLEQHLELVLHDERTPVRDRSSVLYTTAHTMVEDIFASPESTEMMKRGKDLVGFMTEFLVREPSSFHHLADLVSCDYYTYTHSVNVFVYGFSLAYRAGIADPDTLLEFGYGTLLHDVGKTRIPQGILRNKGKLSEDEWKQMRLHPVYGYELLKDHGVFTDLALDVTRHHHEKIGGGGYPDNLNAKGIDPLVRVSTIADIFDALTTRRTYKSAMDSYSALELMRDQMAQDLDPELFRIFVELMGSTPEGVLPQER